MAEFENGGQGRVEELRDCQDRRLDRRRFLKAGAIVGAGGAAWSGSRLKGGEKPEAAKLDADPHPHLQAHDMGTVGTISLSGTRPVDPHRFLTDFNRCDLERHQEWYRPSRLPDGRTLHEYEVVSYDKEIEVAPGVYFPAWTYNGQVPGPTFRASHGDRIRIWFTNESAHPHTLHFHGWHPPEMDGALKSQFVYSASGADLQYPFGLGADPEPWRRMDRIEMRQQGLELYEFDADPVGLHLYHCHSSPLKRHIHKGLYGAFIVDPAGDGAAPDRRPKFDPDTNRPLPDDHPVHEMVVVMNGFDTNFDSDNEVYAANSVAFHYMHQPIRVRLGDLIRLYVVNLTEFDLVNSFHLHAGFFRVYRTGTAFRSEEYTDTAMFSQAERAILEFRLRPGWEGKYMFHAHQSEFAELGWMGFFEGHS